MRLLGMLRSTEIVNSWGNVSEVQKIHISFKGDGLKRNHYIHMDQSKQFGIVERSS